MLLSLKPCKDGDPSYNHRSYAEPNEVPPRQRLLHLVLAPCLHIHKLCLVQRPSQHSIFQPMWCVLQHPHIVSPATKRFIGEKFVCCEGAPAFPNTFLPSVFSHPDSISTLSLCVWFLRI